jgi:hypothetical protein
MLQKKLKERPFFKKESYLKEKPILWQRLKVQETQQIWLPNSQTDPRRKDPGSIPKRNFLSTRALRITRKNIGVRAEKYVLKSILCA